MQEEDKNPQQGGGAPLVSSLFFKVMVKAGLLFRLETLVVNACTGKSLGGGCRTRWRDG